MPKSKTLTSRDGQNIEIISEEGNTSLKEILAKNRNITDEGFFSPSLSDLHDPYLMPDMERAVERILQARERHERVVIFGDYDVDGVSSTALLFRFFSDIGIECSYRLPHRVKDGYWLKSYIFDELITKNVKLVITVDCGTRDIEPIRHAKSLGIDVIVTDHHAVPEVIPDEVVAILNPKRKDSLYPFQSLAWAGVAFKLVHALAIGLDLDRETILEGLVDIASLGTVADCMPLIGENRIITTLGLRQMKQSQSSALRRYIENLDRDIEWDADIIGFQIGPRINAAWRMDSPLKALHWLLANDEHVDDWLEEVESLNDKRQEAVKKFSEDALMTVDPSAPILFYTHEDLEHGLIGLIAGKLTEAYGKPSIVLCPHESDWKREYENKSIEQDKKKIDLQRQLVASCRSPEWCNLVELLDECKSSFVRYGWHRQAAGFTIEEWKFRDFQKVIREAFSKKYDIQNLPRKTLSVECTLSPTDISLDSLDTIDRFRPFGIGNQKPLFLMENLTVKEMKIIGREGNHLSLSFIEIPSIKCLLWNFSELMSESPQVGDILSPIFTLERNMWNGRESVQLMIENFLEDSLD
jgi:single-stranded-DNA-specific exonuclease